MKKKFILVIPAKLKSKRFSEKPLKKILGLPMIIRTAIQCEKAVGKKNIIIATDSVKIVKVCNKHKFNALLTKKTLTEIDRVSEVAKKIKAEYYIKVQDNEPIFNPDDIKLLLNQIKNRKNEVFLGFTEINKFKEITNKNVPKVCFDKNLYLLYASRSVIPFNFTNKKIKYFKQVLAYAFPRKKLLKFSSYTKKDQIENNEDIEILRFFKLGIKVKLVKMSNFSHPVDKFEDIKIVEKLILKKN